MAARKRIMRLFDTIGDGSGGMEMADNWSGAVKEFRFRPGNQQVIIVTGMSFVGRDGDLLLSEFIGTSDLSNGIQIQHKTASSVVVNLTDPGERISQWKDFNLLGKARVDLFVDAAENDVVLVNIDLSDAAIRLEGPKSEYLAVLLNDDFSSLNQFRGSAWGYDEADTT